MGNNEDDTNKRRDQNEMSFELANQLLDELRLKVRAEQFADDIIDEMLSSTDEQFPEEVLWDFRSELIDDLLAEMITETKRLG
jgi:hypothetical protein